MRLLKHVIDADYYFLINLLETYVNNNYSYEKLAEIFFTYTNDVSQILSNRNEIVYCFGVRTWNLLKEHQRMMKRGSFFNSSNLLVLGVENIQIRSLLKNPDDNDVHFTKYQILALNMLRSCYLLDGNLSIVASRYSVSMDSLFAYLSSSESGEIISPSACVYLQTILSFRFLYLAMEPKKRKDYFKYLLTLFYQYNGSLIRISSATQLSIPVLRSFFSSSEFSLLANLSDNEILWVQRRLKEQENLYNSIENEVAEQILFHRKNITETSHELDIQRYAVKQIVKKRIPEKDPFRGVLVQDVLSSLGD